MTPRHAASLLLAAAVGVVGASKVHHKSKPHGRRARTGGADHPDFRPKELTLSHDESTFCGTCKWLNMDFSCDFRAKYLIQHWHMTEEESKQALLDQGACHPKAEQERGADEIFSSFIDGAVVGENQDRPESFEEAAPRNEDSVQSAHDEAAASADQGHVPSTYPTSRGSLFGGHEESLRKAGGAVTVGGDRAPSSTGVSGAGAPSAREETGPPRGGGLGGATLPVLVLINVLVIAALEHRRRRGLERKLLSFRRSVEEDFRRQREQAPAQDAALSGEEEGRGEDGAGDEAATLYEDRSSVRYAINGGRLERLTDITDIV